MQLIKELQDLFDELQTGAYNPTYHNYYYKEANQIIRKHVEALLIQRVSNCKTEPKLNRLETELGKLQKVHGEITKHFELHSGCDSFKFKDGAVYRVKIERNQTKATLD